MIIIIESRVIEYITAFENLKKLKLYHNNSVYSKFIYIYILNI